MKILYGLAGEGFGHSSRALVLGEYLKKKGHIVKILTYGQANKILKDKFDIFRVKGLHLYFNKNSLNIEKTLTHNLKEFSKNFLKFKKFHRLMKNFSPDLCISDMEPIVPVLSFWYKVPLISFDNQHRITNLKLDIPTKYYKDYLFAKGVVNRFVSKADYFIISSFAKSEIKKKNTFIVPPIIRGEVKKLKPRYDGKILVYLTKKNQRILNVLKNLNEEFIVYGYNIEERKDNLIFRKRDNFLEDLRCCKAVIATSGFTLISESLYLKKPYLALPLGGQFEQILNALFLKKSGFGDYSENLTYEDVKKFLENSFKYKKNLKNYNPNFNMLFKVVDKILKKYEHSK